MGTVSYENQLSYTIFGNPNQNHVILIQGLPLEVEIHLALKTPTISFPNHSLAENPFHPTASVCVPQDRRRPCPPRVGVAAPVPARRTYAASATSLASSVGGDSDRCRGAYSGGLVCRDCPITLADLGMGNPTAESIAGVPATPLVLCSQSNCNTEINHRCPFQKDWCLRQSNV